MLPFEIVLMLHLQKWTAGCFWEGMEMEYTYGEALATPQILDYCSIRCLTPSYPQALVMWHQKQAELCG